MTGNAARCPRCGSSLRAAGPDSQAECSRCADKGHSPSGAVFRVEPAVESPRSSSRTWILFAVLLVGLATAVVLRPVEDPAVAQAPTVSEPSEVTPAVRTSDASSPPAPPPRNGATVSLGERGEPTRIDAPRPESVLREFCDTPLREPVALAASVVGDNNLWLGVYRDHADLSQMFAIAIRKDHGSGRWVVGDGRTPVEGYVVDPAKIGKLHRLQDRAGS